MSRTRQDPLQELVRAALAVTTRYRAENALRDAPPAETFNHPALGPQDNCVMVPVRLLNQLAIASARATCPGLQFDAAADMARLLRSSVPHRWHGAASAVGAAQGYIAELETRVMALDPNGLDC